MLESALIESTGRIRTARRYTTIASIGLQAAITGFLLAYPMLYPEALPHAAISPAMLMPPTPPAPKIQIAQQTATRTAAARPVDNLFTAPMHPPTHIDMTPDPAPPNLVGIGPNMGQNSNVIGAMLASNSVPPPVTVAPTPTPRPTHLRISEGVGVGLLIQPIRPVYPAIARATHTQGAVVVQAVISKTGSIESLQVVSGPEMLRVAAMDAIRAARYQPYKLNGEPIEVQTTITINFVMGS